MNKEHRDDNQAGPTLHTKLHNHNAYWMARLAFAVYEAEDGKAKLPDQHKILQKLRLDDSGFTAITPASQNRAQGMLVEHRDYYCLAFRGTDEAADWLDNINAISVAQLFGQFHRGFWQSVQDVWEILFGQYRLKLQTKKLPLFITGHSLGGAMATIAAAILSHRDMPFTSCYTFGQPRAMDKDTARIFNVECKSRVFRFHNNNDIVTRVPARAMGYSHVGEYLYIAEEGTIHNEPGFWFRFVDFIDGAVAAIKEEGIDAIADHDMNKYLSAVDNWRLED